MAVVFPGTMVGQDAAGKPSEAGDHQQYSVQVSKIDPGDLNISDSFQMAIYENLLDELNKTKRFERVYRDGEHQAREVPNLLVLKTTVEKYTPGSETRRAVTTVTGATKLKVRTELLTQSGDLVLYREVNGDVHFFGSNLRATHNLAHNIAKTIQHSSWSGSGQPAPVVVGQL